MGLSINNRLCGYGSRERVVIDVAYDRSAPLFAFNARNDRYRGTIIKMIRTPMLKPIVPSELIKERT